MEFQKIAARVADSNAEPAGWVVCLNISRVERGGQELWEGVTARIAEELHWARYAISYDKLLLNFDDYGQLLASVVERLDSCRRCVDLGSGTGNGTLALLETHPDREVWAVEASHAMLQYLIEKVTRAEAAAGCDYFGRLKPFRADILRLGRNALLPTRYFDGAMMVNVLYTLDDPERCLRDVHELLRPGGILVLSTPHRGTDVDRLFDRMRQVLENKGLFARLRSHYESARRLHESMMERIHRDTRDDIRGYLERAGFVVRHCQPAYVDAVEIVVAERSG
jgi:SAM-dependent methyltransferase